MPEAPRVTAAPAPQPGADAAAAAAPRRSASERLYVVVEDSGQTNLNPLLLDASDDLQPHEGEGTGTATHLLVVSELAACTLLATSRWASCMPLLVQLNPPVPTPRPNLCRRAAAGPAQLCGIMQQSSPLDTPSTCFICLQSCRWLRPALWLL